MKKLIIVLVLLVIFPQFSCTSIQGKRSINKFSHTCFGFKLFPEEEAKHSENIKRKKIEKQKKAKRIAYQKEKNREKANRVKWELAKKEKEAAYKMCQKSFIGICASACNSFSYLNQNIDDIKTIKQIKKMSGLLSEFHKYELNEIIASKLINEKRLKELKNDYKKQTGKLLTFRKCSCHLAYTKRESCHK